MNVLGTLQRNPAVNSLAKKLRINRAVDFYLRRFPLTRKTRTGLIYRVDSVPSLVVAREIFATDVYAKPIATAQPRTFVDLGSNVGYSVLIAEIMNSRSIKGLCVEPNPQLHAISEFHCAANGLNDVHLLKGAVAAGGAGGEVEFFLNPSHIASSLTGNFNPNVAVGGETVKIRVPVVNLAREWQSRFGDARVGLLKIDIEGSEIEFLKAHADFLKRVDAILIEWHLWVTTLDEVSAILTAAQFALKQVCHADQHAGTAFFRRRAG
jgi:FkbM family methyltransferase